MFPVRRQTKGADEIYTSLNWRRSDTRRRGGGDGLGAGTDAADIAVKGNGRLSVLMPTGISMPRGRFDGNLNFARSRLGSTDWSALNADLVQVTRTLDFRTAQLEGEVTLAGTLVGQHLVWTQIVPGPGLALDLREARADTFVDDRSGWPEQGRLQLLGFRYELLRDDSHADSRTRVDWLRLQPRPPVADAAYEELAAVEQRAGHEHEARQILIAKEDDETSQLHGPAWLFRWAWGVLSAYGYEPWRAFWFGAIVIAFGSIVFSVARRAMLILPTDMDQWTAAVRNPQTKTYPTFNSLVYSIEMFTPILKLFVADKWLPDARCRRPID